MSAVGLGRIGCVFFCASLLSLPPTTAPAETDRNQLWLLVSLKCMRHLAKSEAPIPCDAIDTTLGWDRGVALLKDRMGVVRELAIPTHPVTGIEDPSVLADDEPNYFATAWSARNSFRMHLLATPPGAYAVVVDSKGAREQDQLHLILDCLDPDVSAVLAKEASELGTQWREMSVSLKGRIYWARRVESDRPEAIWPFRLLAKDLPGARETMGAWSLAMTQPATLDDRSYILLADRAEGEVGGRARDLLDPSCAAGRKAAARP
jgi:CDP-diacylglycerol pyrophosphatase